MKRILKGVVVSSKMNKTVAVEIDLTKRHKVYGKLLKRSRNLLAHDEVGVIEGDTVLIEECVPYSKRVAWIVKERVQ